jgi:hypothetical protein
MRPASASPDPEHAKAAHLRRVTQRCCSTALARTVKITGACVVLLWPNVHAIQVARDIRFRALVTELQRYGDVLAADDDPSVITPRF